MHRLYPLALKHVAGKESGYEEGDEDEQGPGGKISFCPASGASSSESVPWRLARRETVEWRMSVVSIVGDGRGNCYRMLWRER